MNDTGDYFAERRRDKKRMIKTTVKPLFGMNVKPFYGTLSELNPQGAKVLFEINGNSCELDEYVEKHFLLTFKFNQSFSSVVTHAVPKSYVNLEEGNSFVFSFFGLNKKHSSTINHIIESYGVTAKQAK